ncbi:MAG: hypothetical protein VKP62_12480 [Candidatus Sericytochromatia bacterium]|nr:hypothetical protein [Candidatus Sericytochromatia bacterium]
MTRIVLLGLAATLTLAACGRAQTPSTGPKPAGLRAQAKPAAQAAWATRVLVNGEPAWDYMSARENDTWTFTVEGAHIEQIRWKTDARMIGAANASTIKVNFPRGMNLYEVRCNLRSQKGELAEHRIGVLMPNPFPQPSLPPNPLPPVPLPKP